MKCVSKTFFAVPRFEIGLQRSNCRLCLERKAQVRLDVIRPRQLASGACRGVSGPHPGHAFSAVRLANSRWAIRTDKATTADHVPFRLKVQSGLTQIWGALGRDLVAQLTRLRSGSTVLDPCPAGGGSVVSFPSAEAVQPAPTISITKSNWKKPPFWSRLALVNNNTRELSAYFEGCAAGRPVIGATGARDRLSQAGGV